VVGAVGNPGQTNYVAAKAGLTGMTKALAQEVASRGITVNCVAPGFIATPMTAALDEKQKAAIDARIPAGRMGSPEDVAAAVVYLASDEAAYVTGQTLHVNGGMAMIQPGFAPVRLALQGRGTMLSSATFSPVSGLSGPVYLLNINSLDTGTRRSHERYRRPR
jgi:NAD(P)-dependent dehydrogenase (short-subunit alcohol dehydrogenase family)